MTEKKGWIGVDLDGTLAHYDEWKGADHIGPPIPKMREFVLDLLNRGIDVRIMTARVGPQANSGERVHAAQAIRAWCMRHLGRELPTTHEKDFAMIWLYDDRCTRVEKNTGAWFDPGHQVDPPVPPQGGFDPQI